MAGWVMSARRVIIPGRGDIGCRSIATILTSFRGVSVASFSGSCVAALDVGIEGFEPDGGVEEGNILRIACRCFSALSSHAERPNFSPLIKTRDRTCDHEPGAAHRSTTLVTSLKRSNSGINY